jgi:hypothetical protein
MNRVLYNHFKTSMLYPRPTYQHDLCTCLPSRTRAIKSCWRLHSSNSTEVPIESAEQLVEMSIDQHC